MNRSFVLISAVLSGCWLLMSTVSADEAADPVLRAQAVSGPIPLDSFVPPSERDIPDNEFGDMVRLGKQVFLHTPQYAAEYVGNGLDCANCHLGAGRLANSAPLWAAWVAYPAFRKKTGMVNTMEERIQGCFEYSMNGTAPPSESPVLKSLMAYSFWMATGAPTNTRLPGAGYPVLDEPAVAPDFGRGEQIYAAQCALCHGDSGQGTRGTDGYAFPPLWGDDSFNWGAGMHRVNTAASFISANMPLARGGTLSVQEAFDVAYFMVSHDRPPDPRAQGDIEMADKTFHGHYCRYGDEVDGKRLVGASE